MATVNTVTINFDALDRDLSDLATTDLAQAAYKAEAAPVSQEQKDKLLANIITSARKVYRQSGEVTAEQKGHLKQVAAKIATSYTREKLLGRIDGQELAASPNREVSQKRVLRQAQDEAILKSISALLTEQKYEAALLQACKVKIPNNRRAANAMLAANIPAAFQLTEARCLQARESILKEAAGALTLDPEAKKKKMKALILEAGALGLSDVVVRVVEMNPERPDSLQAAAERACLLIAAFKGKQASDPVALHTLTIKSRFATYQTESIKLLRG